MDSRVIFEKDKWAIRLNSMFCIGVAVGLPLALIIPDGINGFILNIYGQALS